MHSFQDDESTARRGDSLVRMNNKLEAKRHEMISGFMGCAV
jgi:hypothetical protein